MLFQYLAVEKSSVATGINLGKKSFVDASNLDRHQNGIFRIRSVIRFKACPFKLIKMIQSSLAQTPITKTK
jgi:hypothetical protein